MKIMPSVKSTLRNMAVRMVRRVRLHTSSLANPVLVYQMGKVASSSIYRSLKAVENVNVFHVHRLNPEHIARVRQGHTLRGVTAPNDDLGLHLFKNLICTRKPAKIISLVREPIGRNISAYFQNLKSFETVQDAHSRIEVDQLITGFLQKYSHDVPLTWFDLEMRATTGIDVFEYTFPKEQGHQIIHHPPYHLLLMRHDLADALKEELVRDFVGLRSFNLFRANEASLKEYAEQYRSFVDSINVPADYSQHMLSSKYALHFYSKEQLLKAHRKWTGVPDLNLTARAPDAKDPDFPWSARPWTVYSSVR
jgi:hypothetical protein